MDAIAVMAAAPLRTVRPVMLREIYANPEKELVRLRRAGRVVRIAPGTYTVKPDSIDTKLPWRPALEEVSMAYATGQYGDRVPVLYGIGAARFHRSIPRAIAVAVVAVPAQHRAVILPDNGGRIVFTTTDTSALDVRLETSTIGAFLVTTPEQTFVDLIARPNLGGMQAEAIAAINALQGRIDHDRVKAIIAKYPHTIIKKVRQVLK